MGFWTYGDADKHQCNDRCWCNGDSSSAKRGEGGRKPSKRGDRRPAKARRR